MRRLTGTSAEAPWFEVRYTGERRSRRTADSAFVKLGSKQGTLPRSSSRPLALSSAPRTIQSRLQRGLVDS